MRSVNMKCFRIVLLAGAICAWGCAQNAPSFEVASIKLNHSDDRRGGIQMPPGGRFVATGIPVRMLITIAYKIKEHQLSGGPSWLDSERYDISAKPEIKATSDEVLLMLQSMLAERFQLTLRKETKELPVYVLTVAKNGPKMEEWTDGGAAADGKPEPGRGPMRGGMMRMGPGQLTAEGIPVSGFVDRLANILGRNVIDKTGLTGKYNFDLKWALDEAQAGMMKAQGAPGDGPPPDNNGPSIFSAVQDQLGLKLEAQKGPVEVYVITGIEKPSEN
jgi:uncharacterized protein (TIGR03435 family)